MLRALSAEWERSIVAGSVFAMLNLVVGVVRVAEDRSVLGGKYFGVHVTVPVWFMTRQLLKSGTRGNRRRMARSSTCRRGIGPASAPFQERYADISTSCWLLMLYRGAGAFIVLREVSPVAQTTRARDLPTWDWCHWWSPRRRLDNDVSHILYIKAIKGVQYSVC